MNSKGIIKDILVLSRSLIFVFVAFCFVFICFTSTAETSDSGYFLFQENCSSCHQGNLKVGPDLKGVIARREKSWLIDFIISSTNMYNIGDSLAVSIINQYDGLLMPDQELDAKDVGKILNYLDSEKFNNLIEEDHLLLNNTNENLDKNRSISFLDGIFWVVILSVIVILMGFYKSMKVKYIVKEHSEEKDSESENNNA